MSFSPGTDVHYESLDIDEHRFLMTAAPSLTPIIHHQVVGPEPMREKPPIMTMNGRLTEFDPDVIFGSNNKAAESLGFGTYQVYEKLSFRF